MTLKRVVCSLAAISVLNALCGGCSTDHPGGPRNTAQAAVDGGVKITQQAGKLRVEINGELFTEYNYEDAPRPYFYPILGFGGRGLTRNYPMKLVEGEDQDHKHHRGLWYGHRMVNGFSFWEETGKEGKIAHDAFLEVKSGRDLGIIKERNKWLSPDGKEVCREERTIRIQHRGAERLLDFDITINASNGEVVFGDDKDGAMSIRVAESMRLTHRREKGEKKAKPGEGHIVLSTGVQDAETWGKQAAWCDYYGPVDGKIVGVAIFDHPSNPRHPTWWHVRDYGLFAANPFGKHNFEKLADKNAGNLVIPAGKSVTFRYRFFWHEGDEKQGKVAEEYQKYIASGVKGGTK